MNLKKMERYLRVNLLGPGPRLRKKNLRDRGLTKVEKHCVIQFGQTKFYILILSDAASITH